MQHPPSIVRNPITPVPPSFRAGDGGRLLNTGASHLMALDLDLLLRYTRVARLLERMLAAAPLPLRVLEVGCGAHNVLNRLLNADAVRVSRCDVDLNSDEPDFFVIPKEPPWPVADDAFDAVVALEVLEHLPRERRRPFLAECLRVSRYGVILTTPNAVPEVAEAEMLASAAFQIRHGRPHPYLQEHLECGLASVEEVTRYLRELDCPHAVFDSEPVDLWLAMLVLAENLKERGADPELRVGFNQLCFSGALQGSAPPYRKIYVCAKSFDATAALEPLPELAPIQGGAEPAPIAAASLQHLIVAGYELLTTLLMERRRQQVDHEGELGSALQGHRAEVAGLLEDHRADLGVLREQQAEREFDLQRAREQAVVFRSFLQALVDSKAWRWLEPLRLARKLVRPRGFDGQALIAWNQLVAEAGAVPGTWQSTGPDPYFIIPCSLPRGWLHVRLRLSSEVAGQLELYTDNGTGTTDTQWLARDTVNGVLERDFFVYLAHPALSLRLAPLDRPGRFRIEHLEVRPVSPAAALWKGWRGQLPVRPPHGLPGQLLADGRAGTQAGSPDLETVSRNPRDSSAYEPNSVNVDLSTQRPRIVYVLRAAGLCGGVKVVLEHVSRLRRRGHNVCLYYLELKLDWFAGEVPAFQFKDVASLKQALADFRGIKVATWYETAPWVAESLRPGDRGYYLVQDIEECYCHSPAEAAAVLETYSLGLKALTEGTWVRDQLLERFGLESAFVSIGLDLDLFRPYPATRDPNCILTQARTWSGGAAAGARLKGWDTACNTILRCREINPRTSLLTFSMEEPHRFPRELPHIHHKSPGDEQLAKLYSRAGMYLLTSNHEGFGLTAAEAMACGCPVVATRAQGNEEFCIDGVTALLADTNDVERLAQHCVTLQTDPRLAAELALNGRRFILEYTWDRVIDRLEQEFFHTAAPEIIVQTPTFVASAPALSTGEYPDLRLDELPSLDWSVVIPTVNDVEQVTRCIKSCREHLPARTALEFIVVDDGTRDASLLRRLEQAASDLEFKLLLNHQNLGFSATVNHGMRHARGRYVVLCNNDIVFFRPWVEAVEGLFDSDPDLGIVGARLLYPDGTIQHAGMDKVPARLQWCHAFGHEAGDHPKTEQTRLVWSVTGALLTVTRPTLRKLGGLSTGYATAWEDVDFCLHAWSHGIRVAYCADAIAYHLEGATRGATPGQKSTRPLLWMERERAGNAYFEKKWAVLRHIEDFEDVRGVMRQVREVAAPKSRAAVSPGVVA